MVLEDYDSIGMSLQILLRRINFRDFLMVADGYVHDNSDSYSRLPSDVDHVVRLLFHGILVMVHLPLIDYFNGCTRAHSL
jgi:hypothetical protein